jgi:hypothetical protein
MSAQPIVGFDVNETPPGPGDVRPAFERVFSDLAAKAPGSPI